MKEPFVHSAGLTLMGGFTIDVTAVESRAAVKDFINRVNQQEVFAEIRNPEFRNKNKPMEEYNDNVCAIVYKASPATGSPTIQLMFNLVGPAKHVLEDINIDDIELIARADLEMIKGTVVIKRLTTFDINIKTKST